MLISEALVSLIIGILGFIYKEVTAYNTQQKESYETKLNEAREAIAAGDAHGVLSDQHDRVSQELRDS